MSFRSQTWQEKIEKNWIGKLATVTATYLQRSIYSSCHRTKIPLCFREASDPPTVAFQTLVGDQDTQRELDA